jgi:hypothetical protein
MLLTLALPSCGLLGEDDNGDGDGLLDSIAAVAEFKLPVVDIDRHLVAFGAAMKGGDVNGDGFVSGFAEYAQMVVLLFLKVRAIVVELEGMAPSISGP